jgi:hypothetical protein
MVDVEMAFCWAATGLGAPVITDEGVVVGPVVAGTSVAYIDAGSFEIENELTLDDQQARKERNRRHKLQGPL